MQFQDEDKRFTNDTKDDYDLADPNSKAVFVVLWLNSIEPPFYFHLNNACRTRDATLLPMLTPRSPRSVAAGTTR